MLDILPFSTYPSSTCIPSACSKQSLQPLKPPNSNSEAHLLCFPPCHTHLIGNHLLSVKYLSSTPTPRRCLSCLYLCKPISSLKVPSSPFQVSVQCLPISSIPFASSVKHRFFWLLRALPCALHRAQKTTPHCALIIHLVSRRGPYLICHCTPSPGAG